MSISDLRAAMTVMDGYGRLWTILMSISDLRAAMTVIDGFDVE